MRLFLLALLFSTTLSAKTLDKVVAVVQGKPILLSDVQSLRAQVQNSTLLRGFYKIEGGITDRTILNRLVEDQIVRARLKELGTEISGDSVNREIEEICRKNKLTVVQLKDILKKQKVDFTNYFDALKSQIERRVIFNREIANNAAALSDEELKAVYRTKAPPAYKLSILVDGDSSANKKILEEIGAGFKKGSVSEAKLKDHPGYVDLGWMMATEVAEHFKKGLQKAQAKSFVGPIKKDGKYQLLIVENIQRGSDEQFERVKESFRNSVDDLETEKKFAIWFEKQKNQLEVNVNSI